MNLQDKRVVITGGSSGIGLALAHAFANAGVMHAFDVASGFPLEMQLDEIDIDVTGPVRLVHHFLPGMLERRGHDEITPGQSLQIKWMSRLAPGFLFGQLNKSPRG